MVEGNIKRVRIAEAVIDAANEQFDYYLDNVDEDSAMLISETLASSIERIITNPYMGRLVAGLNNYRYVKVGPFHLYHRLEYNNEEAFIFMLRHEAQRPPAKKTTQNRAAKAKKGSSTVIQRGGASGELS